MSIGVRQAIERAIVTKAVESLLAANYELNVDNGGDTEELPSFSTDKDAILGVMFATDDESIVARKIGHKSRAGILLVYGNDGPDVISDYNISLESAIKPALDLATAIDEGRFSIVA